MFTKHLLVLKALNVYKLKVPAKNIAGITVVISKNLH